MMSDLLKSALVSFVEGGGQLFAPATETDIVTANALLAAQDCPILPGDYISFLRKANGGVCFGFVLYPAIAAAGDPSTVEATIKERKADHFDRCHVVGQGYNSFIPLLRDWATGEYRWHDEDGSLIFRYETFESMVGALIDFREMR